MDLNQVIVDGTLKADGTIELDKRIDLSPGPVQVIVFPLPPLPKNDPFWQRMASLWNKQKERGFVPRTVDQVESERRLVRDEWDERMSQIERVRAEAELLRTRQDRE